MKQLIPKKSYILLFLLLTCPFIKGDDNQKNYQYYATTRWVASIVELAGISPVNHFAPTYMVHPPEYELKPDDILKLSQAEYVFYAGYEKKMVAKIRAALNEGSRFKMVQIKTENSRENLRSEAQKLARQFNSQQKFETQIREVEKQFKIMTQILKNNKLYGKKAFVHFFQVPLAKSLNFDIAGVFGPGPINAQQLVSAKKAGPVIIIDNYHNPIAKPLLEVCPGAKSISLLNFPGLFQTKTILDVLKYNEKILNQIKE